MGGGAHYLHHVSTLLPDNDREGGRGGVIIRGSISGSHIG